MAHLAAEQAGRNDRVHGDESDGREIPPEELTTARDELADEVLRGDSVGSKGLTLADALEEQGDWTDLSALLLKVRNAATADDVTTARADLGDYLELCARRYFNESAAAEERAAINTEVEA